MQSSKHGAAYAVNLTVRAERDLVLLFDAINAGHSEAAIRWYRGLRAAILSLEGHCPQTPENARLRHLLFGNKPHIYRVIYRVREKARQVEVLHIRHGARERFTSSEIK